jgi:hypothetical protein
VAKCPGSGYRGKHVGGMCTCTVCDSIVEVVLGSPPNRVPYHEIPKKFEVVVEETPDYKVD